MKDTWASGVIELLKHAESHAKIDSAFDMRIAFISIDNSVETAIRTFINLPKDISGVNFPTKEVNEAGNSFPNLTALIFKHAGNKVSGLDAGDIEHYHRIRNHLYHEGTGFSVDPQYLKAYRQIAYVLLEKLFNIILKEKPTRKISLETLILLWNQIESTLKIKMAEKSIDIGHTFKWEQAIQYGILDTGLVKEINDFRNIRNNQVHSTSNNFDQKRIEFGIDLGEKILNRLNSSLIKQVDSDIEWFKKQQKPMSHRVFKEAVDRIMTNILWRNGRMKAQLKLKLKNGEEILGFLGGRGQSAKKGYRYNLVADDGSSQTIQYNEIDSILEFDIIKYD